MQLTPTSEGLIKHHPHKTEIPKDPELEHEGKHHMQHLIKEGKKEIKYIMSKIREQQKEYQHSIGGKMKCGHHTTKHKKY